MKKIVLLLLIHTLMICLASCAFVEQFHYCESACEECGGCRDLDCPVGICSNKCDGNHPAHQHSLTKVEGTLPTCEESGVEAYFACECGKMFSDEAGENEIEAPVVLDALGHSEEVVSGYNATCTETGLTDGKKCSVCGVTTLEQEEIPAKEHSFTNYASNNDATCTADGTKTAKCDRCDVTDTLADEGSKLAHSFTNYVSDGNATCIADGTKTAKCDRCDVTDTKTEDGSAKGHDYGSAWMSDADSHWHVCANGCGIKGDETAHTPNIDSATETEAKICTVCSFVIEQAIGHKTHVYNVPQMDDTHHWNKCYGCDAIDSKVAHSYSEDITLAPTCTEAGTKKLTCSCGHTKNETIPAKGHTDETVPGKAATCTETGLTEGKKCSVCGVTTKAQDTISAKGHTEETVAGKDATCTETGLTEGKKCSVCGVTTLAQETIPAKGHTEETVAGKDATCTETGLTEGKKCSVCGVTTKAQDTISAKGHTNAQAVKENEVAPNCTDKGSYDNVVYCSVCSAEVSRETIPVDALGHKEETVPGKAATCTETGLTEGKKCSVCGVTTLAQETVPAKGHTDEIVAGKAATCTEAGLKDGKKCSVCGVTTLEQEEIPALGHSFGEWVKVDENTHQQVCACGEKKTAAHNFDEGVITQNPTEEIEGIKLYTCDDCGHTKTEVIDRIEVGDITSQNTSLTHNFTAADQSAQNNNNPPSNRVNVSYVSTATASATAQKATKLATNEDYLGQFYGGAAVTYSFTSSVSGKATVTFKISSGYITKKSGTKYETGDMVVNKVMKITVNGEEIIFGDDVVLNGDKTKQSYACMANWTYVTFEVDLLKGENTIVLTSLYPVDGEGNLLYKDPGTTGTQSSFLLDTVSVALVKPDLSNEVNSFTHNYTTADQSAKNNENPPQNRVNLNYVSTAGASATAQLATKLATNEDYLNYFYGGAAVTKTFISTVAGKATVTFKIASGYLTKVENPVYESGDMIVNKVMKFTVNGVDIVIGDDVVLNGDATTQTYACLANWTYVTFEIDVVEGENTIVLTSLCPKDENGEPLYKDPGVDGTQSSFHLDTVTVTLK